MDSCDRRIFEINAELVRKYSKLMRKKSYDLLITDLKMAEVNGIEILEMMRDVLSAGRHGSRHETTK